MSFYYSVLLTNNRKIEFRLRKLCSSVLNCKEDGISRGVGKFSNSGSHNKVTWWGIRIKSKNGRVAIK